MHELCFQVCLLVSIPLVIASISTGQNTKEDYDIGEIAQIDLAAATEQEGERIAADMDDEDALHREQFDLKSADAAAAMAEMQTDRERLLLETINEEQDSTYSWAQNTVQRREYSSASAASANKKGSPEANEEGKTRNKYEALVQNFEKKLIASSSKFSSDEKKILECIHPLGELSTKSELLKMRKNSGNCKDSLRGPKRCRRNQKYRSIDGSCNNVKKPKQGMVRTTFRRLLPPFYEDNIEAPRGRLQATQKCLKLGPFDPPTPSARLVSKEIVTDSKEREAPLTHMVMQWGQFLDHDIDLAPEIEHEGPPNCDSCSITDDCEPIKIPKRDTLRKTTIKGNCISFRRSVAVCDANRDGTLKPREQLNDVTSYIDGSQIYGSNETLAERLRKPRCRRRRCFGRLDTSDKNLLPVISGDECLMTQGQCFIAGDVRANEQVGLTTLHTLFVREHNRIAGKLRKINRHWNSDEVYQETRKIVGAILQKITYEDYLPSVLGKAGKVVMRPYKGYSKNVDASIPNVFATAAYRYGHSLVQPQFITYSSDQYENGGSRVIQLQDSFFNIETFKDTNIGAVLRGLVTQQSLRNDESVNSVLTNQLFERRVEGRTVPGFDLVALNIQRGREHGLPVYSAWRSYCKSVYPNLPNAVIENVQTLWKMYSVYGTPEVADLFIAGLAEKDIKGSVLGPTFACIFGITFSDLRDGDSFYYENPGVFTRSQLRQIKRASLSRIICDNTNIKRIQRNAFKFVENRTRRISCRRLKNMKLRKWKDRSTQQQEQDDDDEEITNTDEETAEFMEEEDDDETQDEMIVSDDV